MFLVGASASDARWTSYSEKVHGLCPHSLDLPTASTAGRANPSATVKCGRDEIRLGK